MQHFPTRSFPPSPISNRTKTTAQYTFLYIPSVRTVHNSHNVSAGLQKLTVADLQYILRAAGSVMYLKQVKCPRFWCNGIIFVDTISCGANGTVTVCCDCQCTANGTVTVCCDCQCTVTVSCDCQCTRNETAELSVTQRAKLPSDHLVPK